MNYSKSDKTVPNSPKLEEWALISKHKALEEERMKEMQRMQQHYKKMKFKGDLDQQRSQKNDSNALNREQDRKYFQYITNKAKEQKQREQRQKMQRHRKRMQMQQQNKHILEVSKNSRLTDHSRDYELEIGLKSQNEQKEREIRGKKEMLQTLEQQVKQKHEKNQMSRLENYLQDQQHFQKQGDIFSPKNRDGKFKQYKQNEKVYHHYQNLLEQKRKKQLSMQKSFIEEAGRRKIQEDEKRKKYENHRRQELTHSMKETLDEQVLIHNYKKNSQKQVNPEDYNFGFISNIFREHPPTYDKNKYYEELKQQAQEQKQRKKTFNYMSEQQYKLNMNQLNKMVSGSYAYDKYVDRSLGAIGQRKIKQPILEDQNSMAIKQKLEGLRNRRGAYYSPISHQFY